MAVETKRSFILIASFVILLTVGGYLWLNRGYGDVSPMTYQFSKALYSACLKKSDEHLATVKKLIDESNQTALPTKEREWLEQIIDLAQSGQWESAATEARRIMEDQVIY